MIICRRTGYTPRELDDFTGYEYQMLVSLLIDEQEK